MNGSTYTKPFHLGLFLPRASARRVHRARHHLPQALAAFLAAGQHILVTAFAASAATRVAEATRRRRRAYSHRCSPKKYLANGCHWGSSQRRESCGDRWRRRSWSGCTVVSITLCVIRQEKSAAQKKLQLFYQRNRNIQIVCFDYVRQCIIDVNN